MNRIISVNLYAGPGSGKSTSAAAVFANLKNRDCNVELIQEHAKRLVYQGLLAQMRDQRYMLREQYRLMSEKARYGVPLIITDSPLLLSLYYGRDFVYPRFIPLVHRLNNRFENVNVFVRRVKKYNPSGRLQTAEQSDEISAYLHDIVRMDYTIDGNPDGQAQLSDMLFDKYKERIQI